MASQRKQFPFSDFEPKWQSLWLAGGAFRAPSPGDADFDPAKPKYYVLDMFPYPSGEGLHVGHVEGYTSTDIIARFKRMRGYNVLHPMGWDAFGLPAEQFAIRTGQHPRITTQRNIARFRAQLQSIGFSYDWTREFSHYRPRLLSLDAVDLSQTVQLVVQSQDPKGRADRDIRGRGPQ